jgi:uncharacterized protein (TIGR00730 family)
VPPDDPKAEQRVKRLMRNSSFIRADKDPDLLQRDELRPTRLLLEYLKPELGLQDAGIESTIVVFGGTRIMEPAVAKRNLMKAKAALKKQPQDIECKRRLSVAKRLMKTAPYYDVAREFAGLVSGSQQIAGIKKCVIMTGGGPGIMEAANRGAFDVGAKSAGLSISLPHEQYPNPYVTPGLCFEFRYFALRKMHFLKRAKALVAFPGGFGTLDELFVTLTLIQTRTVEPIPVVLVGETFWKATFNADHLAAEGLISPEDVQLFAYAETAQEIIDHITAWYKNEKRNSKPETD